MTGLVMVQETFHDDDEKPHRVTRAECGWASAEEAVESWRHRGWRFIPYRNGIEYTDIALGRWTGEDDLLVRTRIWFEEEPA